MGNLKTHIGMVLLLGFFALNATLILTSSLDDAGWMMRLNQWFGLNILVSLTILFLLSTRLQILNRFLGGINRKETTKRLVIILSLGLIYVHVIASYIIRATLFTTGTFHVAALWGVATYVFFGLLVLLLLIRASSRTNVFFLHTVMMIVYGVTIYHTFVSLPFLVHFSLLSVWVVSVMVVGFVAMMVPPIQFIQQQWRVRKYQTSRRVKVSRPR